jgi:hypothetical protein
MTERRTKRSLKIIAKTLWGFERVFSKRVLMKSAACALVFGLVLGAAAAEAPPGHNIHLVREVDGHRFWRGGAPTKETVRSLVDAAIARKLQVTFVDLRSPDTADDRSGKGGRLSPTEEKALAEKSGARYVCISALKKPLVDTLTDSLKRGDVYMHCMYGVNRTGFACARYATALKIDIPRDSLGKRDWEQGVAFQKAQR